MQVENLTKEQFIRDFKDTLHHEQLIKVAKATPTEIFTALAGLAWLVGDFLSTIARDAVQ